MGKRWSGGGGAPRTHWLRLAVAFDEIAAQDNADAEHAKHIRSYGSEGDLFRSAIVMHKIPAGRSHSGHILQGRGMVAEVHIVGVRPEMVVDIALEEIVAGVDQSAGVLVGRGRSSTAFATLNIAVLAPIPRARVMTAVAVKTRLDRRVRAAYRKSRSIVPRAGNLAL